ncbi:MAG: transposase [Actinobacteria bacterium]|nr:transposase [Actinomycetota bacterium]
MRWGSFSVYGVKLHLLLLCATNGVPPLCYELTAANVAEVKLTEELLTEAGLGEAVARRLLGDLAYHQSEALEEALADCGVLLLVRPSVPGKAARGTRWR